MNIGDKDTRGWDMRIRRLSVNQNSENCQWLDSNLSSLVAEAIALPIVPLPGVNKANVLQDESIMSFLTTDWGEPALFLFFKNHKREIN